MCEIYARINMNRMTERARVELCVCVQRLPMIFYRFSHIATFYLSRTFGRIRIISLAKF